MAISTIVTSLPSQPFSFSNLPESVPLWQDEEILRKGKGATRLDLPRKLCKSLQLQTQPNRRIFALIS